MIKNITTYWKQLDTPTKVLWGIVLMDTAILATGFIARKPSATVTAEMIRTLRHFIPTAL